MKECSWAKTSNVMEYYHNFEWCVPSYDDRYIFEMLTLEGAQAGLSWSIVLSKREKYKNAFNNFDIKYCSSLNDKVLEEIRDKYNIIKNILKIKSVKTNALAVIKIQEEYGSFSNYLWKYVDFKPIINNWDYENQMPSKNDISEQISKDLIKRGFKFVGPVIIYSFMQAIGMVDDHIKTCPYYSKNKEQ